MLEVWHVAFILSGWNSLHCLHLRSSTQTLPYPYSLGGTAACPPTGPVSATGNSELAFRTATSMRLLTDQNAQVWHKSDIFNFYMKIHLPYHSHCFLASLATNSLPHVETQGRVRELSSPRATSEGPYCQDCTSLESPFETVPSKHCLHKHPMPPHTTRVTPCCRLIPLVSCHTALPVWDALNCKHELAVY